MLSILLIVTALGLVMVVIERNFDTRLGSKITIECNRMDFTT